MKLGSKDYIQKQLLEDKLIPLIRTLQKEHEKRLQWNIPIFVRQGEAYQKIKKRVRLVATTQVLAYLGCWVWLTVAYADEYITT